MYKLSFTSVSLFCREEMDWQGDFLHDHAFVELQVEGIPSEVDIQNLIRDTEEKLRLNACRSVA